jgi:hypothetical protein
LKSLEYTIIPTKYLPTQLLKCVYAHAPWSLSVLLTRYQDKFSVLNAGVGYIRLFDNHFLSGNRGPTRSWWIGHEIDFRINTTGGWKVSKMLCTLCYGISFFIKLMPISSVNTRPHRKPYSQTFERYSSRKHFRMFLNTCSTSTLQDRNKQFFLLWLCFCFVVAIFKIIIH